MSTRNIRIIVVLMALAIMSLIAVQAIWISSIINVSREELKRASLEAMSAITERLEKNENVNFINKKMKFEDAGSPDTAGVKMLISSHEVSYNSGTKHKDSSCTIVKKTRISEKDLELKIDARLDSTDGNFWSGKKVIVYAGNATIGKKEKDFDLLIKQMVRELGSKDLSAVERINKDTLNAVIKSELIRKGLDLPFAYAIYSPASKKKYPLKSEKFTEELEGKSLSAELFPADLMPKKDFLLVHLEQENGLVFTRIRGMLFLTLFITLLILTVFYITIRAILKQKKLAEIKNDFINNMSHEFKTPIATISIAVDAINNPKVRESSEKLDYYSGIVKEENKKMNAHVEKVLTLALAEKQQLNLALEKVNMHELVESSQESFELLIEEKQVQVHSSLNAEIHTVRGDSFHLGGVVKNIIDNAVKYSAAMPVMTISTWNEGDYFYFSVKDNGPGMSKEVLKNIFDKFYRAQTGNIHDVKGFGLGLNYVKNIMDAHRGEVIVKSEQGKGSEFILKLRLT